MKIRFYNTLSKSKEDFVPIDSKMIKIYSCGPTVYSEPHIGNIRYFWFCSLLRNVVEHIGGYQVTHVMNITDVGHLTDDADAGEDKMEKGARKFGGTARDVAKFYTNKFEDILKDMDIHFEYNPKATEYIQEQIDMVQMLEKNGHTYIIINDGVYFDTSTMEDYGALVGKKHLDGLQSGARVDDTGKKNITDFALWKFNTTGKKRDMERISPRGIGFPGRHIECSAMSHKLLGKHFDIHTGGIDHIPIHHTNEIAQSECSDCDTPWVNYRLHSQFLNVDGQKISKSLGNDIYISQIIQKGFTIEDLRMFFLSAHYKSFQDFTREAMEASKKRRNNLKKDLQNFLDTHNIANIEHIYENKILKNSNIIGLIADDLNMPGSIGELANINIDNIYTIYRLDKSIYKLGLFNFYGFENFEEIPIEIKELAKMRRQAKLNKNYVLADNLRNKMQEYGRKMLDGKNSYEVEKT